jgi:hypothetical protein
MRDPAPSVNPQGQEGPKNGPADPKTSAIAPHPNPTLNPKDETKRQKAPHPNPKSTKNKTVPANPSLP